MLILNRAVNLDPQSFSLLDPLKKIKSLKKSTKIDNNDNFIKIYSKF